MGAASAVSQQWVKLPLLLSQWNYYSKHWCQFININSAVLWWRSVIFRCCWCWVGLEVAWWWCMWGQRWKVEVVNCSCHPSSSWPASRPASSSCCEYWRWSSSFDRLLPNRPQRNPTWRRMVSLFESVPATFFAGLIFNVALYITVWPKILSLEVAGYVWHSLLVMHARTNDKRVLLFY